jgi:cbb3-type cytochrome oxidase maturation protein
MYFPYFIAYIAIGLVISLPVFFWALRSGQFQDQQRARFLPLRDPAGEKPVQATRLARWEIFTLFLLASAGLAASAAALVFAVYIR